MNEDEQAKHAAQREELHQRREVLKADQRDLRERRNELRDRRELEAAQGGRPHLAPAPIPEEPQHGEFSSALRTDGHSIEVYRSQSDPLTCELRVVDGHTGQITRIALTEDDCAWFVAVMALQQGRLAKAAWRA